MSWRVYGEAHGSSFDETGFGSWTEATDYASSVLDGDIDATIAVEPIAERIDHDGSIGAERLG